MPFILKVISARRTGKMIKDTSTSHERKLKGKATQDQVERLIKDKMPEIANDISTAAMSSHGEDIILTAQAREKLPYSIECKQDERGFSKVYRAFQQAQNQATALASERHVQPIVVIQQGDQRPLVAMDLEHWTDLVMNAANTNKEGTK